MKRNPIGPKIEGGTRDARKVGAAILDVLAGQATPSGAASALGTSLQRYYALESRALAGLVAACEPRPRGKRVTPDQVNARLRKEIERLEREVSRKQALVRAGQRAIGIVVPEKPAGKRRRKPVVRALKAAEVLRSDPPAEAAPEQGGRHDEGP